MNKETLEMDGTGGVLHPFSKKIRSIAGRKHLLERRRIGKTWPSLPMPKVVALRIGTVGQRPIQARPSRSFF
jgi:hypothetical protein